LLDVLAVDEVDLSQIAADSGADIDRIPGPELAGELGPFDEIALDWRADGNRRGWRCVGGGRDG
jgi:hypothetical protein